MALRYLEKFTSADGNIAYVIPTHMYEWESSNALRIPTQQLVGADFAYDSLGFSLAPLELGIEAVRGLIVADTLALAEIERDDMAAKMYLAGRGLIYILNDDGTRRWSWGRLLEIPQFSVTPSFSHRGVIPFIARFQRYSTWFTTDLSSILQTITTASYTLTFNNPGSIPTKSTIIRLKSLSTAGFTNPKLVNATTGYTFETARDAVGIGDMVRLDTERGAVEYLDRAAQFTGANLEYLSIADNPALSVANEDFTFCGWVYLDSASGADTVIGKMDSVGQLEYHVRIDSGVISFEVFSDGTTSAEVSANYAKATGPALGTATWHFFVAWYDATADTINIQVNNGVINSDSHANGAFNGTSSFRLGNTGFGTYFDGRMRSIGFWKRILSAAEREWLYEKDNLKYTNLTPGLKASMVDWWNLSEASGTRVGSHAANNLTDNNTVTSNPGVNAWTDDFAQVVIPTLHPPLAFPIANVGNTIYATSGGTPNYELAIEFYPAYN